MESRYELFDHTADVGVRVFAPTLAGLVEPAAWGLYAVIGRVVAANDAKPVRFDLAGDEAAVLLRDYLAEVLRLFELDKQVVTAIDVEEFSDRRLVGAAQVGTLDRRRSALEHEVKAVTYHQLEIRPVAGGFEATYIVDI